jgi:L-asparaginase
MAIRIFVTGGTFDKEYNELTGELYFQDSHIKEMLRKGRCRVDVQVRTLMMVDSLTLDDDDREMLRVNCARCPDERIVVTHGTDTLEATARCLAAAKIPKTIVLTGAMIPYTFGSSDGLFNLGSALAYAQVLPHGVYVAINGRCFHGDNVRKDRRTGTFETLDG